MKIEKIENSFVRHQQMLTGTSGLNEDRTAHLLVSMKILHIVWHDMEVLTIACFWAKSAIFTACF